MPSSHGNTRAAVIRSSLQTGWASMENTSQNIVLPRSYIWKRMESVCWLANANCMARIGINLIPLEREWKTESTGMHNIIIVHFSDPWSTQKTGLQCKFDWRQNPRSSFSFPCLFTPNDRQFFLVHLPKKKSSKNKKTKDLAVKIQHGHSMGPRAPECQNTTLHRIFKTTALIVLAARLLSLVSSA